MILRAAVEPVRQWRFCHPRMARPDVIRHGVEEKFHVLLAQCRGQFFVIGKPAEMRINGVQIRRAVAVIILLRSIFHNGREPQRGHAKFLEIRDMIANSAQIAAMPRTRFRAIVRAGKFCRFVICRIAVRETVRHDQVENIVGTQAVKSLRGWFAIRNRQFK